MFIHSSYTFLDIYNFWGLWTCPTQSLTHPYKMYLGAWPWNK